MNMKVFLKMMLALCLGFHRPHQLEIVFTDIESMPDTEMQKIELAAAKVEYLVFNLYFAKKYRLKKSDYSSSLPITLVRIAYKIFDMLGFKFDAEKATGENARRKVMLVIGSPLDEEAQWKEEWDNDIIADVMDFAGRSPNECFIVEPNKILPLGLPVTGNRAALKWSPEFQQYSDYLEKMAAKDMFEKGEFINRMNEAEKTDENTISTTMSLKNDIKLALWSIGSKRFSSVKSFEDIHDVAQRIVSFIGNVKKGVIGINEQQSYRPEWYNDALAFFYQIEKMFRALRSSSQSVKQHVKRIEELAKKSFKSNFLACFNRYNLIQKFEDEIQTIIECFETIVDEAAETEQTCSNAGPEWKEMKIDETGKLVWGMNETVKAFMKQCQSQAALINHDPTKYAAMALFAIEIKMRQRFG